MSTSEKENLRLVEAFIFASNKPVPESILKKILPTGIALKALLERIQKDYLVRGVNLVQAGDSWSFHTAPDINLVLNKEIEKVRPPSRAATEVLAIIAYHQPITRAEIEEIRGVSLSKGTLDFLFGLEWIRPKGRRKTPGRPVVWATTDTFLNHFGFANIKDLPGLEDLKEAGLLESGPAINLFSSINDLSMSENSAEPIEEIESEDTLLEPADEILLLNNGLDEEVTHIEPLDSKIDV